MKDDFENLLKLLDDFVSGGLMRPEYRELVQVIREPEELRGIWKTME